MTNKYPIAALVLLLAGLAIIANTSGVCPFSSEAGSCQGGVSSISESEQCTGDHANCSANCTGSAGSGCALNGTNQSNCTTSGSCPIKKDSN